MSRALLRAVTATCVGLRDGLRPQLFMLSVCVALAAGGFWLLVFALWHAEIWQWAQGVAHWFLGDAAVVSEGAGVGGVSVLAALWHQSMQALSWVVTLVMVLVGLGLLIMLSMQVMLELFLMPKVQRQCLLRYPSLSSDGEPSWRFNFVTSLKLVGCLLLGLPLWLIPILGPFIYMGLAAYLSVRSLVNDALEGVATPEERQTLVGAHRWAMLSLGLMMQLMLMIPLLGWLMASVVGASVCHLFMPPLVALRGRGDRVELA